ncbi:MAG: glycoside hydrolase family 15 protein [Candidatus Dormibacteraeota bacterium]|nr:glycoside hydrolase family 15 protein [Candidatus Dormibacteraeota bacterium]
MSDLGVEAEEAAALGELAKHSHAVITANQDPNGAYPACQTFSAYKGYAWLRDGAFTAEGISRFGDVTSADRFHDWANNVLASRGAQVEQLIASAAAGRPPSNEMMLPARFTLAGDAGSDPWWDFQTDGYGMWLWSAVTHARRHRKDIERWRRGIDVAVDYVTIFWDRPCYDWWEENVEHRHVSTLAAIYGGLRVAVEAGVLDPDRRQRSIVAAEAIRALVLSQGVAEGHLSKWLATSAVDGSLTACVVPFGLIGTKDPIALATIAAVANELDVNGGVHRYHADVYYGGGQWLLLSALLGWNLAVRGDTKGALKSLRWMAAQANAEGDLPEQVPTHLLHPASRQEWVDRWGTVATPLLWSHGMYLILADELGLTRSNDPLTGTTL